VVTNNFLPKAVEVASERVGLVYGPAVGITYSVQSATFHIVISAENHADFTAKRQAAETVFLGLLGVTRAEACELRVLIRTLPAADLLISDQIFPLSFCAN
jgi:hypothetical protein